jgi:hypothetical protein
MSKREIYGYIGNRITTCFYRFNQIFEARDKHFLQTLPTDTIKPQMTAR